MQHTKLPEHVSLADLSRDQQHELGDFLEQVHTLYLNWRRGKRPGVMEASGVFNELMEGFGRALDAPASLDSADLYTHDADHDERSRED